MKQTALRAFVSTVVVGSVVVLALALWKLKLILALLFLGFIVAAAMRPGIEALRSASASPAPSGSSCTTSALLALIAALLWAVVPRALDQVQSALGDLPQTRSDLRQEARESTGIRSGVLIGVEQRLRGAPPSRGSRRRRRGGRPRRVRGVHRHLLRARDRRVLDLRAQARARTSSAACRRTSTRRRCATPGS